LPRRFSPGLEGNKVSALAKCCSVPILNPNDVGLNCSWMGNRLKPTGAIFG
jgi:hypothetical protein